MINTLTIVYYNLAIHFNNLCLCSCPNGRHTNINIITYFRKLDLSHNNRKLVIYLSHLYTKDSSNFIHKLNTYILKILRWLFNEPYTLINRLILTIFYFPWYFTLLPVNYLLISAANKASSNYD